MNSTRYGLLATITAFSACGTLLTPIVAVAQDEQVSEETEILTRGPVHEAFAEAVSFEPEPGILISTQPPEMIDELPPEQELEGDNVTWIPGYWAWDEDSSDFLWISGIWRNIPPDREWVPGYWNEVGSEYQWVSGYWSDTGTEEVTYLPAPPRSLEAGPNIAAASDNDVWIPGTWVWSDTRYRWRPGYYQPYREDWTYVPDRYSWTPRGYVYVTGYWDYVVPRRGVIFAPVRFHHHVYRRPNFYYSPVTVISLNLFVDHLFVRPRYSHYYFGDYYEPSYRDRGFIYNVNYARMRGGFDPIFAHRRWEHRHDRNWERNRLADFDFFRDNRDARPPRSWANLRDIGDGRRGFKGRDGKDFALATPLAQFVKNPVADAGGRGRMNFKKLDGGAREKIVNQRKQMVDFTKQRKQIEKEAPVGKAVEGEAAPKPVKAKLNRSPIMGRKAAQLGDQAPPKRKQAPAVADKDPVADGTPQPGDNKPGQPGRPGRGGQGQGGGKGKQGQMTDDNTTTPDQPGRPGRGGQGGGKGKGGNAGDDTTTTPDQPGRPGRGGQGGGGKGKQGQMTDDNKPAPAPKKEEATPAPKREPKPQQEKVQPPKRQPQPERQVQPKKQPQPERQVQPKKQAQPQPERQVQPKKQAQPQRERQVQPKKQAQPQPERQVQPKKQAQPQREAQPQRAQPKREAQPQRQQPQRQPQRPQGGGGEGGGKGKNKEKEKNN